MITQSTVVEFCVTSSVISHRMMVCSPMMVAVAIVWMVLVVVVLPTVVGRLLLLQRFIFVLL